jgi:hypothetical protein
MPKATYDPALRKSKEGARLYETWKRMRRNFPYDPAFDDFKSFYDWSIRAGYELGDALDRRDNNLPHGPDNSIWKGANPDDITAEWAIEWCEKWDNTVSKIRRQLGLPPLKGGK